MNKPRLLTLAAMIFSAAFIRLIPHPWNMTPVAAMALFAGAQLEDKRLAFAVPLLAVFLSDLILGSFYSFWWLVYMAHASIVLIGFTLRHKRSVLRVASASIAGSLVFFLVSNLAHFFTAGFFPMTLAGLMQCYTLAIPFFRNTLLGDLCFTALLFGSFHLAERRFPVLRPAAVGVR
jgi:hypothetical protein